MTTRAERATVLAVDNQREYRRRYERRLGDEYEVLTAESAAVALDLLGDGVDVVLLDRDMPDMSEDEVLASIRSAGSDCRVALVTTDEPDEDVIDRGYDAYLVEPVTTEELSETVDRLLARSEYDAHIQELYSLCVKRAKARADGGVDGSTGMSGADRQGGDGDPTTDGASETPTGDVAVIEERIREVRETVDDTVSTFDTADYRASFRDLHGFE